MANSNLYLPETPVKYPLEDMFNNEKDYYKSPSPVRSSFKSDTGRSAILASLDHPLIAKSMKAYNQAQNDGSQEFKDLVEKSNHLHIYDQVYLENSISNQNYNYYHYEPSEASSIDSKPKKKKHLNDTLDLELNRMVVERVKPRAVDPITVDVAIMQDIYDEINENNEDVARMKEPPQTKDSDRTLSEYDDLKDYSNNPVVQQLFQIKDSTTTGLHIPSVEINPDEHVAINYLDLLLSYNKLVKLVHEKNKEIELTNQLRNSQLRDIIMKVSSGVRQKDSLVSVKTDSGNPTRSDLVTSVKTDLAAKNKTSRIGKPNGKAIGENVKSNGKVNGNSKANGKVTTVKPKKSLKSKFESKFSRNGSKAVSSTSAFPFFEDTPKPHPNRKDIPVKKSSPLRAPQPVHAPVELIIPEKKPVGHKLPPIHGPVQKRNADDKRLPPVPDNIPLVPLVLQRSGSGKRNVERKGANESRSSFYGENDLTHSDSVRSKRMYVKQGNVYRFVSIPVDDIFNDSASLKHKLSPHQEPYESDDEYSLDHSLYEDPPELSRGASNFAKEGPYMGEDVIHSYVSDRKTSPNKRDSDKRLSYNGEVPRISGDNSKDSFKNKDIPRDSFSSKKELPREPFGSNKEFTRGSVFSDIPREITNNKENSRSQEWHDIQPASNPPKLEILPKVRTGVLDNDYQNTLQLNTSNNLPGSFKLKSPPANSSGILLNSSSAQTRNVSSVAFEDEEAARKAPNITPARNGGVHDKSRRIPLSSPVKHSLQEFFQSNRSKNEGKLKKIEHNMDATEFNGSFHSR